AGGDIRIRLIEETVEQFWCRYRNIDDVAIYLHVTCAELTQIDARRDVAYRHEDQPVAVQRLQKRREVTLDRNDIRVGVAHGGQFRDELHTFQYRCQADDWRSIAAEDEVEYAKAHQKNTEQKKQHDRQLTHQDSAPATQSSRILRVISCALR